MERNDLQYYVYKPLPTREKLQTSLLVFFLVEGTLTITYQEERNRMSRGDILLINPGMGYEISQCKDALVGKAVYPLSLLSSVLGKQQVLFRCNSVRDLAHSYQPLREVFFQMTAEYASGQQSRCLEYSELFRLLDLLTKQFRIGQASPGRPGQAEENESDLRMQEMMTYILSHLDQEISLNQLAADMYVSTSTLSRIFRKNAGVYFADYVTNLRVQLAMGLLENTEQNVTKIAVNCGFMNSASFNRSFRKVTGLTPSEYRQSCRRKSGQEQRLVRQQEEEQIRAELRRKGYLQNQQQISHVTLDLQQKAPRSCKKAWDQVINIGPIWDLTNANVQYHTLYLSEQLHFRYIRVWNVFSRKMMLSNDRIRGAYNYNMVDQALDFMAGHQLTPFIDFGRRPDTAIGPEGDTLFYDEQYIEFASRESWRNLVDDFLSHVVERYSQDVVSNWIFELSRDSMHGEKLYQDPEFDYFEAFCYFYRCVKRRVPRAKFGGIGDIAKQDWNYELRLLQRCREHSVSPDFVSLGLFGAEHADGTDDIHDTGYSGYISGLNDPAALALQETERRELGQILEMRRIMERAGFGDRQLFVTEWNITTSNRNYLNDSCYRAASLVRKMSEINSYADMIGIMGGTDWVSNYVDSVGIVNGSIGLLTRDMIPKPAFYAVAFMNRLGRYLLDTGDYYVATRDEKGDLYLLFFYCTWTRKDACLQGARASLQQYGALRDAKEQSIRVETAIDHLEEAGEYILKRESVNREHGSILDEWGKFDYDLHLGRDEVKYLQSVSVPGLTLRRERVEDGRLWLKLSVELEPGEISLVHIHCRK